MKKWQNAGLVGLAAVTVAVGAFAMRPTPPPVDSSAASNLPKAQDTVLKSPDPLLVHVIGDSFVAGSAMGGTDSKNWTAIVQKTLSTKDRPVEASAVGYGGSGYVEIGPTKKVFIDAVPGIPKNADLVVFFGSINDIDISPAKLEAKAKEAFAAALKQAPDAELLVMGPSWSRTDGLRFINERRDALRSAAKGLGVTFYDPIKMGWFQGNSAALIGSDGTHPTDEGHAYMAKQIIPVVKLQLEN